MSTLSVELNGDAVHAIRTPDRFTTTGPFAIEFENLGRSTHVHLHLDDELDRVASLPETNHFVDDEATRRVHISVSADHIDEPVHGKLKIVTGYGSNTRYVDVRIDPPVEATPDEVTVDETLTRPPERPPDVPPSQQIANAVDRLIERGSVPAAILAFVALAAGVAVAIAIDSALVSFVIGVVVTLSLAVLLLAVW